MAYTGLVRTFTTYPSQDAHYDIPESGRSLTQI